MAAGTHPVNFQDRKSPYYTTAVFCFVVLGFSIWINAGVLAGPHRGISVPDDPRNSISKHVLRSEKGWRKPKKPKNAWRNSKTMELKDPKGRFKKKTLPLYDPKKDQDTWDPYSLRSKRGGHTKPATLFEFRF